MRVLNPPVLARFPLSFFDVNRAQFDLDHFPVKPELKAGRFPQRMMRYYVAHGALLDQQERLGGPIRLLDHGCERGLLKMLAGHGINAEWHGVDWNVGRPSLAQAAYDTVQHADFDQPLPVADHFADAAVSLHVLEHVPRPEFTLGEIARVLRPGGVLLLGVPIVPGVLAGIRERQYRAEFDAGDRRPGRHINKFHVDRVLGLLRGAGFEVEWWTGTHLLRWSGSFLESSPAWVRLNQWWGWLAPGLGRELYVQARKPAAR